MFFEIPSIQKLNGIIENEQNKEIIKKYIIISLEPKPNKIEFCPKPILDKILPSSILAINKITLEKLSVKNTRELFFNSLLLLQSNPLNTNKENIIPSQENIICPIYELANNI